MKKIIILITVLIFTSKAMPDNLSGKLSGKVSDLEGPAVQYASVTINELSIFTTTDSAGYYEFSDTPFGNYHLTFSKTGYKAKTILIEIKSQNVIFDISLEKTLIETATIDVTSSFVVQDISSSTFSISTINSKNLTKSSGQVLGSAISNLPGVNSLTTGIGLGKPVIRGLSSNSVLIIHDGVKQETQQWGDEHSPEISLFDLDRIEILRGPASLIYGAEGLGGVVNIISKQLQFSNYSEPIYYGTADLGGYSVNNEGTGNLTLGFGLKNLGAKGHFGYRNSGNVKTPDGTFLVNTLNPSVKDTIVGGTLSNSKTNEVEGGFSFGLNGNFCNVSAGFETFNRAIQMHDPDPFATGNQKLNTNQIEVEGNFNLGKNFQLVPILSYQDHSRKEFESIADKDNNNPLLNWQLKTFESDVRLQNTLTKNISGTFGLSAEINKNQSLGERKLIPNYNSASLGIYASEKYQMDKWTFSLGGRFDEKNLNIETTVFDTAKTINPQTLKFNSFSGSAGIVYRPIENIDLFTNIGRGWRPPTEFELFVDGEHEGTGRIERGIITLNPNASPNPETSLNFDFGVRTRYNIFNAEFSIFRNAINNFLFPAPTNTRDSVSGLPIYYIKQDKSTFTGIEYSLQIQPLKFLLLSLNGDYMTTKNSATGNSLPFTPPSKNIIEVKLQGPQYGIFYNPYINISAKIVSPQNNVDPLETTTAGYTLFNVGFGFDFVFAKAIASVDISVDNITDTKYVDHLSRYKSYALNLGRSYNLKLSMPFQF